MHNIFRCKLTSDGEIREISASLADYIGYSAPELNNLKISSLFPAENNRNLTAMIQALPASGDPEFYDSFNGVKRNGETFSVLIHGVLVRNASGEPDYVACTVYNYGEEQKTREKLSASEQQIHSLFHENPLSAYTINREGIFEHVNKKLIELSGYSEEEIIGQPFMKFLLTEDLQSTKVHFEEALEGQYGYYELGVRAKDGKRYHLQVTNFPRYVQGEIVGIYGFIYDITQPKESENRWRLLVEQNPEPVQIIQNGEIVFINEAGARYYGAELPEELIGAPLKRFSHPDYHTYFDARYKALSNGEELEPGEHKMITLKGEEKMIKAISKPIQFNGRPAIQTVLHDVTEFRREQDKINASLKQKEILVQEIHHRVKNNLSVISSLLELQILNASDEKAIQVLRNSQHRIQTIAMVHEKLYQSESLMDICLRQHLTDLITAIQETYAEEEDRISINYELDDVGLGIMQAIPCSLIANEAIVNCFKHAFDQGQEGLISVRMRKIKGEKIEIAIEDNGKGLPESFNTDQTTSLGITLIRSLSESINGSVIFSQPQSGTGTILTLRFKPEPIGSDQFSSS